MSYQVKEIYYTLQGEGEHSGRPAVFCRFVGCNLWTGREEDRSRAICKFCDTNFLGTNGNGGGVYETAEDLADMIEDQWPGDSYVDDDNQRIVVCTGGEPLLQLDTAVINALHHRGFIVTVETNGTILPPHGIDWICVSPKANAECILRSGQELKLVFPQLGGEPERYESYDFERFFLQPMDGPNQEENMHLAAKYCLDHPRWKLSIQTHKLLGLP